MSSSNDDEAEQSQVIPAAGGKVAKREDTRALQQHLIETLHKVTDAVTGRSTVENALTNILASAVDILGADSGALQIMDVQRQRLRLAVDFCLPDAFAKRFDSLSATASGIYQRACDSSEQIVIPDVRTLADDDPDREIADSGEFSAMHVTPMIGGDGQCAGLLSLYFVEPLTSTDADGDILNLLARQALTVIQHRQQRSRLAELVKALRQRTKDLETSERKLTVQTAELRAQDVSRENFISMLGHELRNPLAAIINSLELMDLTNGTSQAKPSVQQDSTMERALGVIRRQSRHLGRLIDDLLDINRLSRGKLHLQLETVDVNQCIDEAVTLSRARTRSRDLELDVSLPPEPLYIQADPERLTQIMENLIRNAISFTPAGGRIMIEARPESCFAAITVSDSGIGMDQARVKALFDSKKSGLAGSVDGGLGLGLTLVRQLVDLHGGAVTAYSAGIGMGSEFTLRLPLSAEATASVIPIATTGVELPPQHRVLVVDDKPDNADALSAVLSRCGQKVKTAYSGESALEKARDFTPDVAFLDLSMPVMDGYELAERLRAEFGDDHLTLIALTGQPHMQQSSLFDHHLMKPMQADRLIELLKHIDE